MLALPNADDVCMMALQSGHAQWQQYSLVMLTIHDCNVLIFYVFFDQSIFWKIFQGEMLNRTLPTILLQIFCECVLPLEVMFESVIGPDESCHEDFQTSCDVVTEAWLCPIQSSSQVLLHSFPNTG